MATYPAPIYNPPQPIFNPAYFPQSFDTVTTGGGGGGGGGGSNIFPSGLSTGGDITYSDLVGANRELNYVSTINLSSVSDSNPLGLTLLGQIQQTNTTLEIGQYPAQSQKVNFNTLEFLINNQSIGVIGNPAQSNVGIGNNMFSSANTGNNNTAVGTSALLNLTSGNGNTAIGTGASSTTTSGGNNVCIGDGSFTISTNSYNTGVGHWTGYNNTSGNHNTFLGCEAGFNNTTGQYNIFIGNQAGGSSDTLSNCIAIGSTATPTSANEIIFETDQYHYVSFYDTGNGYALSVNAGNSGQPSKPNLWLESGNAIELQASGAIGLSSGTDDITISSTSTVGGIILNQTGTGNITSNQYLQIINKTSLPTNLTTSYGGFITYNGIPYFGYNNAGTTTWTQLSQIPVTAIANEFGYSNVTGVNKVNIGFRFNIPPAATIQPQSLFTLHMNFSYFVTLTTAPYTTTSLIISGSMIVFDLYSIAVQGNFQPFTSAQITNTATLGTTYANGSADLGMIKILQPTGNDWTTTYNAYPQIQVNNITYDGSTGNGLINIFLYPAPSGTSFSGYKSGMNGFIELKNSQFFPTPLTYDFEYIYSSL